MSILPGGRRRDKPCCRPRGLLGDRERRAGHRKRPRSTACRTRSDPLHARTIRSGHTNRRSEARDMLKSGTTLVTPTPGEDESKRPCASHWIVRLRLGAHSSMSTSGGAWLRESVVVIVPKILIHSVMGRLRRGSGRLRSMRSRRVLAGLAARSPCLHVVTLKSIVTVPVGGGKIREGHGPKNEVDLIDLLLSGDFGHRGIAGPDIGNWRR